MNSHTISVNIHPTSIIEPGAIVGKGCNIGPFCHVGANVELGDGSTLISHAVLAGHTKLGKGCRVFPFASIGHEPQDLKYKGEEVTLTIGDNCIFREGVTINPGTVTGISETRIGNNCTFLTSSHVAHDCILGDNIIFSNNVMLAGHCTVGDNVIIGGGSGIHQFCRIGSNAFVGGLAGVENDIIPFGIALGNRAYLGGLNVIGMKRAGIERASIHAARNTVKHLFNSKQPISEAVNNLEPELAADPVVGQIIAFVKESADRSLCTPRTSKEG